MKHQQESGLIQVSQQTASKYMKLASNYNRERNLLEATSIRAALELLSDKEPESQQQESGAVGFTERTASKYMRVAANRNRGSDLLAAPSIRAALELLQVKASLNH